MSGAFNILFGNSQFSDIFYETKKVLRYIDGFAQATGMLTPLVVNPDAIYSILKVIHADFPHTSGISEASPFKKAGCFLSYFVAEQPIRSKITTITLGDLHNKNNSENAIVGFQFCIDSLHGASVYKDGQRVELSNPIQISSHSYVDIIESLLRITPDNHFKLVTVLLEQLAYRANPTASYGTVIKAH